MNYLWWSQVCGGFAACIVPSGQECIFRYIHPSTYNNTSYISKMNISAGKSDNQHLSTCTGGNLPWAEGGGLLFISVYGGHISVVGWRLLFISVWSSVGDYCYFPRRIIRSDPVTPYPNVIGRWIVCKYHLFARNKTIDLIGFPSSLISECLIDDTKPPLFSHNEQWQSRFQQS